MEMNEACKCPDCGEKTTVYHESIKHGGRSRRICSVKCQEWKVIEIRERWGEWPSTLNTLSPS